MDLFDVFCGAAIDGLRHVADGTAACAVTSPPYWCVKDYGGGAAESGWESTHEEYVGGMVETFRELRRALKPDGTLALNVGDVFHNYRTHAGGAVPPQSFHNGRAYGRPGKSGRFNPRRAVRQSVKDKDLVGVPWRLALALQADGWWLRDAITWCKPNPLPDRFRDRTTQASEMVFILAKSARSSWSAQRIAVEGKPPASWWVIPATGSSAHVGTMPEELARRLVVAGAPVGGLVLDPFMGAGTTGALAVRHGRRFWGSDLVGENVITSRRRMAIEADALKQCSLGLQGR